MSVNTLPPWDTKVSYFCESLINGFPEPANTVTSVMVLLLGFYGLFSSRLNELPTYQLYAILTVWGSFSATYHGNGKYHWRIGDNIGAYVLNWYFVLFVGERMIDVITTRTNIQHWTKGFLSIFAYGGCLYTVASMFEQGDAWGMNLSFSTTLAITQFIAATEAGITAFMLRKKISKPTVRYLAIGGILIFATNILWLATEPICKNDSGGIKNKFFGYTHAFWHICSSLGMHFIAQCVIKMELLAIEEPCDFRTSDNKFIAWVYYLIPLAETTRKIKHIKSANNLELPTV
jgi:predicted membrane channel-forming protein YqfA (hemolysin III family)